MRNRRTSGATATVSNSLSPLRFDIDALQHDFLRAGIVNIRRRLERQRGAFGDRSRGRLNEMFLEMGGRHMRESAEPHLDRGHFLGHLGVLQDAVQLADLVGAVEVIGRDRQYVTSKNSVRFTINVAA